MFVGTGTMRTVRNHIGGEWVESSAGDCLDITNPATAEPLCRVPLSTARDVDQAVAAARAAFPAWRAVPPVVRARHLFRLKHVLDQRFDEIAAIITRENGKTLDEARGSLRRGIENVEHACGIPTLMMGRTLEDVAAGIDCEYVRQPLGVFTAVTPFNFPAMVPMWFWPYAIAAGNTFILKPSEQVPLTATRIAELAHEAGFPPGVLNLVHGGKEAVQALLEHPDVAGISFVGSSAVARHVYEQAAKHGKRAQALGGAKNHIVVLPDADFDRAVTSVSESLFGCAGQRCLAGSVVVTPGKAYTPVRDRLVEAAKNLRLGYGLDADVTMGPLVSGRQGAGALLRRGRPARRRRTATRRSRHAGGAVSAWPLRGPDGVRRREAGDDDRPGGNLRTGGERHPRGRSGRSDRRDPTLELWERHVDLHHLGEGGSRVPLPGGGEHDRGEPRHRGAHGVLPLRRYERVVLRRSQGARAGCDRVLYR